MSKKITKAGLISRMELAGMSSKDADKALNILFGIVEKELCDGNSIALTGIGTLSGKKQKAVQKMVAGTERAINERIKISFSTSSSLQNYFKMNCSSEAKKDRALRDLGSTFLKNLT